MIYSFYLREVGFSSKIRRYLRKSKPRVIVRAMKIVMQLSVSMSECSIDYSNSVSDLFVVALPVFRMAIIAIIFASLLRKLWH